ncbi:MAG: P-loop NTPase, partial [Candidatus Omnitrophica bacterium]|nr:P-loop NTPase [Candidatus Omnitrophota bacterium]
MIISVASGKGGTGKTTVATNLAFSINGHIQFLDCDIEEPNAHIFIKPEIEEKHSVSILIPQVDKELCNFCGKCQKVCAFNAIVVLKNDVLVFPEI